jgi:hypothetical protein
MRQLGVKDLTARAWASTSTPGQVRLRIGAHDFVLDGSEAISLAQQIVEAIDHAATAAKAAQ